MYRVRNSFFFIFFCSAYIYGQTFSNMPKPSDLQNVFNKPKVQTMPVSPVLEYPINPDDYIVGPGDVFSVAITASVESEYQLMVNPEGMIVIPSIGNLHVAEMTLTDVKSLIDRSIRQRYVNSIATVTLVQLRSFRVTVSGAVLNPGLVTVTALSRVSDVLEASGGLKLYTSTTSEKQRTQIQGPASVMEQGSQGKMVTEVRETEKRVVSEDAAASLRNIFIRRRNGAIILVDLQKYQLTGDLKSNPFLLDGDVVVVPTEQQIVGRIRIEGSVKAPNQFEYVPGDCIRDILLMAHGFSIDADSSQIELVRFKKNSNTVDRDVIKLDLSQPENYKKALSMSLLPDDRLFVRPKPMYHEKSNVEVQGEVKFPGFYAIERNTTRLSEVIKWAGGFTPEASLAKSYVVRRSHNKINDPEFERLKTMQIADMTEMEREYFKTKSREVIGGMGVNFVQLFSKGDSTQDIILLDDDLVMVPSEEMTINVSGQVINPGLLPFRKQATLNDYIKEAGGYNFNARKNKVRIIKGRTGEWMKPKKNTILEIGDTIFVPEKTDRKYWTIAKDFLTAITQVATIYLVVERVRSGG
jgi:protein involved in polysaccharide export with SLBB domain